MRTILLTAEAGQSCFAVAFITAPFTKAVYASKCSTMQSSAAHGCSQPRGDWRALADGKVNWRWRGDEMDLGLAIEVMLQKAKRAQGVPAGT